MMAIQFLLIACVSDLLTTITGISIGCAEANPLGFTWQMIAAKVILTLMVARVLYGWPRLGWLAWLPAIVSMLAVAWNVLVIAFEVFY